ncbi:MAG TPA: hypothetical protein VF506_08950 [Streptosporangiaceae bacterium]
MTVPPETIHMPCGCPYPKLFDHQPCEHGNIGSQCYEDGLREGAAAERARILRIARNVRAVCPADHPVGAMASFASYIETIDGVQP